MVLSKMQRMISLLDHLGRSKCSSGASVHATIEQFVKERQNASKRRKARHDDSDEDDSAPEYYDVGDIVAWAIEAEFMAWLRFSFNADKHRYDRAVATMLDDVRTVFACEASNYETFVDNVTMYADEYPAVTTILLLAVLDCVPSSAAFEQDIQLMIAAAVKTPAKYDDGPAVKANEQQPAFTVFFNRVFAYVSQPDVTKVLFGQ